MFCMTDISQKTRTLLTYSMLNGVGVSALRKIAAVEGFPDMSPRDVADQVPAVSRCISEAGAWEKAVSESKTQVEEAHRLDAAVLSPFDPHYPQLLAATKDDPFLIFVRGKLASEPLKSVAVIGTREPTEHGALIAARVAAFFAAEGWSVVSGLALGCDGIAHRAALDHGGHTVAVLAHGLHTVAPARHRKLAGDILEAGGALVSEYRFGQAAQPQQFVKRDRTQAGFARGVVMIQSDLKGGSLHASRAALDYKRWLAVPYPTARDRANNEPKVQANLVLSDAAVGDRCDLLRCVPIDLDRVIVLRSKADYPLMLDTPIFEGQKAASAQSRLL